MSPKGVSLAMESPSAPLSLERSGVRAHFHQSSFRRECITIPHQSHHPDSPSFSSSGSKGPTCGHHGWSINTSERVPRRWQILPNCVTAPAGIHSPPLSPAHFLRIGGKITSTNTHCAIHPVVMTCGSTLRMPPPIHRSSPQSPPLHIWTHIPFVRYLPNQRYHSRYHVEPRHCCITAEKEKPNCIRRMT